MSLIITSPVTKKQDFCNKTRPKQDYFLEKSPESDFCQKTRPKWRHCNLLSWLNFELDLLYCVSSWPKIYPKSLLSIVVRLNCYLPNPTLGKATTLPMPTLLTWQLSPRIGFLTPHPPSFLPKLIFKGGTPMIFSYIYLHI